MKIETGKVVALHYKVTTEGGEPRDSSGPDEPMWYMQGSGQIVPGLEAALVGCEAGDGVTITLSPEEAYGENDPNLDLKIPIDRFPEGMRDELEPGLQFGAEHPEDPNEHVVFSVVELEGDHVLVTGNHPLSGETLTFEVSVESVRDPTEDEIAHGHAHGPDGHHDHH
jgi:FKBP-type peptidyl-prolyl cis-trans isomerase SlyD